MRHYVKLCSINSEGIKDLDITNLGQSQHGKMTLNSSQFQIYIEFKVPSKHFEFYKCCLNV